MFRRCSQVGLLPNLTDDGSAPLGCIQSNTNPVRSRAAGDVDWGVVGQLGEAAHPVGGDGRRSRAPGPKVAPEAALGPLFSKRPYKSEAPNPLAASGAITGGEP